MRSNINGSEHNASPCTRTFSPPCLEVDMTITFGYAYTSFYKAPLDSVKSHVASCARQPNDPKPCSHYGARCPPRCRPPPGLSTTDGRDRPNTKLNDGPLALKRLHSMRAGIRSGPGVAQARAASSLPLTARRTPARTCLPHSARPFRNHGVEVLRGQRAVFRCVMGSLACVGPDRTAPATADVHGSGPWC